MSDEYDESEEWTEVIPDDEPSDLYDPTLPVAYFDPIDALAITVQTAANMVDSFGVGLNRFAISLFASARWRRAARHEAEVEAARLEEQRKFDAIISAQTFPIDLEGGDS